MRKKVGILLRDRSGYYFFCLNCADYYNSRLFANSWTIRDVYEDQFPPVFGQNCHETARNSCLKELVSGPPLFEKYQDLRLSVVGEVGEIA
jgi:hypothetical protein